MNKFNVLQFANVALSNFSGTIAVVSRTDDTAKMAQKCCYDFLAKSGCSANFEIIGDTIVNKTTGAVFVFKST